jgi:large subunit ribosomal protein L15
MPLIRRIPKRGFNNAEFKVSYHAVNLDALNAFDDGATVDETLLRKAGLANGAGIGNGKAVRVKILGRGELKKRLTVRVAGFSATAKAAIEKLGGTAEVVA